jgi:hypothetical protein
VFIGKPFFAKQSADKEAVETANLIRRSYSPAKCSQKFSFIQYKIHVKFNRPTITMKQEAQTAS